MERSDLRPGRARTFVAFAGFPCSAARHADAHAKTKSDAETNPNSEATA